MYLYLHKKHQALVPKLSQAIRDIKADGSYNRILSTIY
jgi:polar amino acid transport system substrate-binding protein